MRTIKIQESANIADIERYYVQLSKAVLHCDVQLATTLRNWQFGGFCALIQFLITWAQKYPKDSLITHVQNEAQATVQLDNLISEDHGLVAVLCASDILTADKKKSLKEFSDLYSTRRLNQIFEKGINATPQGRGIFLLCVDHLSQKKEPIDSTSEKHLPLFRHDYSSPYFFYQQNGEKSFCSPDDFEWLTTNMLGQASLEHAEALDINDIQALGEIFYELFSNTHYWARTDITGELIKPGLRGIRCQYIYDTEERFINSAVGIPVLADYLHRDNFSYEDVLRSQNRLIRRLYIEISIFDSGPGLAQRWLNKAIRNDSPLEQEYDAVYCCMQRNYSSTESHHGAGLHRVLRQLTKLKGFLRIRTGRLGLQRDLVKHPYYGTEDPHLFDWVTNSNSFTKHIRAAGTAITILIPVASNHASRIENARNLHF